MRILGKVAVSALWVVVVTCLFLPVFAGSGLASPFAGSWDFEILQKEQPIEHPKLDEGRVAWARLGLAGYSPAVFLYDAESQETQTVSDLNCGYLDLRGDNLVLAGFDGQSSALYLHSIATDHTEKVAEPLTGAVARPVIAGDYVVWEEPDFAGGDYWARRIRSYDMTSHTTRLISESETTYGRLYHALASPSWVVFTSHRSGDLHLSVWAVRQDGGEPRLLSGVVDPQALDGQYLYHVVSQEIHRLDLDSGIDQVVASGSDYQNVRADGNRLAWATWEAGMAWVVYRDLVTDETVRIPVPGCFVGGLKLSGDILIWLGDSMPSYGGAVSYLFAYDHNTRQATRLSPVYRYDEMWSTDGALVAFLERRLSYQGDVRLVLASQIEPGRECFRDVPGTHPYFTATTGLLAKGVAVGYPGDGGGRDFRPDAFLTRAQFAKLLAEALGVPVSEDLVAPFADLGPDDPDNLFPHDYVAALADLGIINGTGPGRFSPHANLTRRQMFSLVVRAAEKLYPGMLEPGSIYPEWLPHPADDLAQVTVPRNGLADGLIGYNRGWNQWAKATRGEAAQVLWNLMEMVAWEEEGRASPGRDRENQ